MSEMSNPSLIVVPDSVRDAEKAKERARQLERRRVALALLPALLTEIDPRSAPEISTRLCESALCVADSLIFQTGGHNE